jgi:NTP pyrophosphatase (non-canonical NTP hydrolase)
VFLQKRIGKWQQKTFPSSNELSKIKHLKCEVKELEKAIQEKQNKKDIAHELADCIFLLIGIADLQQINLTKAIKEKFYINKQRKWGKPTKDGVYFHKQSLVDIVIKEQKEQSKKFFNNLNEQVKQQGYEDFNHALLAQKAKDLLNEDNPS